VLVVVLTTVELVLVVVEPQLVAVLAAAMAAPVLHGMVRVGVVVAAQVDIPVTAAMVAVRHPPHFLVLVAAVAAVIAQTEAVARWAQVEVLGF
jgi:hypothetical protein